MRKTLLTTCNAKYIHKNLALRWIYTCCPEPSNVTLKEYTIKDQVSRIVDEILNEQYQVVCFSCYIWNIDMTLEIIASLKEKNPQLHIIIGGPEVSYESYDAVDKGVNAISIGEGEQSVWEYIFMLDALEPYEVKGIYTKDFPNREYRKTPLSYLEEQEDPYFLEMDGMDMGNRYLYLETSRGCPYGCTYCLSSTDRDVRMFSIEYVIKLLKKIEKSDVQQVKLLDRTFNADPKRALKIARYMNEHCIHQIFQFEIVAETLSPDLLNFFVKEADKKRFRFEIGVQSFNKKTLSSVGRMQNNERLQEVIQQLRDANCTMHVDLIAGLPFENYESFHASFDQLFSLQASELQLGILKLLKGTVLRKERELHQFQFTLQAPYDVTSTLWLSEEEMKCIHSCGDAVEKFWNSGVCRDMIAVILDKRWYQSPFELFMNLGKEYDKLPRPYQPYALFECFYEVLQAVDKHVVDALLLTYYYPRFKQKPHRFTGSTITLEKKKEILRFMIEQGIGEQNTLFRYGVADIAYLDTCGFQLVLYNKEQSLPKQWFIDDELSMIKEIR